MQELGVVGVLHQSVHLSLVPFFVVQQQDLDNVRDPLLFDQEPQALKEGTQLALPELLGVFVPPAFGASPAELVDVLVQGTEDRRHIVHAVDRCRLIIDGACVDAPYIQLSPEVVFIILHPLIILKLNGEEVDAFERPGE